jgi:hypothetical protein
MRAGFLDAGHDHHRPPQSGAASSSAASRPSATGISMSKR